jgi:hypothetical protein
MQYQTEQIIRDGKTCLEGLVEDRILEGNPKTEVGKRAIDLYWKFEESPKKITFGDIQDVTYGSGTQIGNPGNYLSHVNNTAGIFRSLIIALEKTNCGLRLPHPDEAFAAGLVHDLNATFSNYSAGGQQSKEFDEFVLARMFAWKKMAEEVALHSDYIGGIRLMAQDKDFPKREAYQGMIQVLKGKGPLSYEKIQEEFKLFLQGRDRLPLILLTVADYMESGQPHFDQKNFDQNFKKRSEDIFNRYYQNAVNEGKLPSLLGQALNDGGMDRIKSYKTLIKILLTKDGKIIEELRNTTDFFA